MKSFVLSFSPFFFAFQTKSLPGLFSGRLERKMVVQSLCTVYILPHICVCLQVYFCVSILYNRMKCRYSVFLTQISHTFFSLARLTQSHTDSPANTLTFFLTEISHTFSSHFSLSKISHLFSHVFSHTRFSLFSHTVFSHIFSHFGFSPETFLIFFCCFSHTWFSSFSLICFLTSLSFCSSHACLTGPQGRCLGRDGWYLF